MVSKLIFSVPLVALGAVAELFAISRLLSSPLTKDFVYLVFSLAVLVYSFDYFAESVSRNRLKTVGLLILPAILLSLVIGLLREYASSGSLYFLLVLSILCFSYPLYLKNLTRIITGFKDYYVALSWNMFVWLYFSYYSLELSLPLLVITVIVFVRDLVNASYCDVKDITDDHRCGLKTLAIALGEERLMGLLHLLNFFSAAIIVVAVSLSSVPVDFYLLLLPISLSSVFIIMSGKFNRFPSITMDLEYIIWALVLLVWGK